MLPVNKFNVGYTGDEQTALMNLYWHLRSLPNDYPGILVKGGPKIPGIVFTPSMFDAEILRTAEQRFPFLEDKCSFIVTDEVTSEFKPHSDTSHASVFTVLESDGTTVTTWYTIGGTPAFNFTADLYGVVPHKEAQLSIRHTEILTQGNTYLFDSHTFHSVKNTTRSRRIIFTWWLKHIAYAPALDYCQRVGLIGTS